MWPDFNNSCLAQVHIPNIHVSKYVADISKLYTLQSHATLLRGILLWACTKYAGAILGIIEETSWHWACFRLLGAIIRNGIGL